MKLKMKRAISFIAMLVMLVSLFSVCVFPATAAAEENVDSEYATLLNSALVVDPDWAEKNEGDPISYVYRGEIKTENFNSDWHFSSYADAWAYAKKKGIANPTILLNAGTYTETIYIEGGVTLLGSQAGVDPNVKSEDKNEAWALNAERSLTDDSKETIIKGSIVVRVTVGTSPLVLDGLAFVDGGAFDDHERDKDASEVTIKNSVFKNAGNESTGFYALFLRSPNHERTLRLEDLYITGQSYSSVPNPEVDGYGFISPYFVNLYADGVAFIENEAGFIATSWFADGAAPYIDIANSCFYNAAPATAVGYVISVRNSLSGYNYNTGAQTVIGKDASKRPSSNLKLTDNVFYNASNKDAAVLHYQFTSATTALDVQGNYFFHKDGTTFVDTEFLINSDLSDLSSCMVVRNNWLIGAYKVPSLVGSNGDTYIDMSLNYFGRTNGDAVNFPVYSTEKARRLIRTEFWADKDMTIKNTHWNILSENWNLSWVDNATYDVEVYMYTENQPDAALPITFRAQNDGLKVEMFKNAVLDADGIAVSVNTPITQIDQTLLSQNVYDITTLYLKVTDPANPEFTPIYTISISNCGDTKDMKAFSEAFPGYYYCHPTAAKLSAGTVMPYRWRDEIYTFVVGQNLFTTAEEAMAAAYKKGVEIPTVCIPAGVYEKELVLPGSCTILGEKHGVDPNAKPYDYLTQDKFASSNWTLAPERSINNEETIFYAPIRVGNDADDYIITVDGIVMGEGSSYVDDYARAADNVTILKNIYALNAVGGTDRNGSPNSYLFNFNKAYGPLTDRCTLYMYDCRVDGLDGKWLFGPYYEKFVVDGLYYANGKNKSYFFNNMQSRDIANPYYSLTNSYLYKNTEGNSGCYTLTTKDDQGSQAIKTNITYLFDGNIFNDGFQTGYAAMQFYWPGTNMSVNLNNNIFYNTSTSQESFIAQTAGGIRYKGNCPEADCSDILNMKGNRFINLNKVPLTNGTGPGTNFDWSGNYWSPSINGKPYTPETVFAIKPTDSTGSYTYEECTRWTINYTYLDWDLTIRSDMANTEAASLDFGKGPNGTAVVSEEILGGVKMPVYRDTVASDVVVYDNPAIVGEFDTVKYYTDASCTNEAGGLMVTGSKNVYYGVVYPYGYDAATNPDGILKFCVEISRESGSEAKILRYQYVSSGTTYGGLIDQEAKTVYVETTLARFNLNSVELMLSAGATGAYYTDKECTTLNTTSNPRFTTGVTTITLYYKVTSEDGSSFTVYTVTLEKTSAGEVPGIYWIEGATHVAGKTYETAIVKGVTAVKFAPAAFQGSTLAVTANGSKLLPDANGIYTFEIGDAEFGTIKLIATAKNGGATAEYTINVKRIISQEVQILGIENAAPASYGYSMALDTNRVVEKINVTVSEGASYAFYEDYACTRKISKFPIIIEDESVVVYVKATSADGNVNKVVRLTIHTANDVSVAPVIKGNNTYKAVEGGDNDYVMYLPANTGKVLVTGTLEIPGVDAEGKPVVNGAKSGGEFKLYADPQMKIEIGANSPIVLTQKVTKVYYSMEEATYALEIQDNPDAKPRIIDAVFNARTGSITLVSDRKAVNYSDASSVPAWAKNYVDYLNNGKHGIFAGDSNAALMPNAEITRNEIAVVATRVMGLDVKKYSSVELEFSDKVDSWALPYVRAAVATGVISGALDGKTGKVYFNGSACATREQVIKILVSACMLNDGITDTGAAYYKANKNNIDLGYVGYDFADEAKVSEWAVPYVHLAVGKYKLVGGALENGKLYLRPQRNITRAEVIKMVACYMGY